MKTLRKLLENQKNLGKQGKNKDNLEKTFRKG